MEVLYYITIVFQGRFGLKKKWGQIDQKKRNEDKIKKMSLTAL